MQQTILVAEDKHFPGPGVRRVTLDATARTVTFENCHWPRRFLAFRYEAVKIVPFDQIRSAREWGRGRQQSLFVSTGDGRCRIHADWHGYGELSEALRRIATVTPPGTALDDPRWIVPIAIILVLALTAALWFFA